MPIMPPVVVTRPWMSMFAPFGLIEPAHRRPERTCGQRTVMWPSSVCLFRDGRSHSCARPGRARPFARRSGRQAAAGSPSSRARKVSAGDHPTRAFEDDARRSRGVAGIAPGILRLTRATRCLAARVRRAAAARDVRPSSSPVERHGRAVMVMSAGRVCALHVAGLVVRAEHVERMGRSPSGRRNFAKFRAKRVRTCILPVYPNTIPACLARCPQSRPSAISRVGPPHGRPRP